MKNDFDELLSRLDTSEERIFELEGKEADTSKIEKEKYAKIKNSVKKNKNKEQPRIVGELQKVSHRCNGNRVGKERERGIEAIFEAILTEKFPKLITDPGSSENIK